MKWQLVKKINSFFDSLQIIFDVKYYNDHVVGTRIITRSRFSHL